MVLFRRLLCGVRCVEMFVLQCGTVCCIVLHCVAVETIHGLCFLKTRVWNEVAMCL